MDASKFVDFEAEAEDTSVRELVKEGREFRLVKSNQYGFWTIHPKKGPVPKELEGSYTTIGAAELGLQNYLNKAKATNDEHTPRDDNRS